MQVRIEDVSPVEKKMFEMNIKGRIEPLTTGGAASSLGTRQEIAMPRAHKAPEPTARVRMNAGSFEAGSSTL